MAWFGKGKAEPAELDELSRVSLDGLRKSCANRSPRDNAISQAWVRSMPAWCHQAMKLEGGYSDLPHTYGHGGLCHNATKEFERALDAAGYKIVPKLTAA